MIELIAPLEEEVHRDDKSESNWSSGYSNNPANSPMMRSQLNPNKKYPPLVILNGL